MVTYAQGSRVASPIPLIPRAAAGLRCANCDHYQSPGFCKELKSWCCNCSFDCLISAFIASYQPICADVKGKMQAKRLLLWCFQRDCLNTDFMNHLQEDSPVEFTKYFKHVLSKLKQANASREQDNWTVGLD